MSKVIAIDFGLKRCGIAITDELQIIASPLTTVAAVDLDSFISGLISKESISEIVIGYPKDLQGNDTDITKNVELLAEHLRNKHKEQTVILYDERFTSSMASDALISSGMKKKDRRKKENLDMTSAALILQGYLRNKQSRV